MVDMDLKELLGEGLFNQVQEVAGDKKIAVVSDGNWFPKQKFDEVNSEAKSLKVQLEERDGQLEELGNKSQGNEELQSTIDALKEANTQAKQQYEDELKSTRFNYEIDQSLILNKAKNSKAVRALLDTDTVKFGEDGKLMGLNEQIEGLKESDSYLFVDDSEGTPPPGNNDHKPGQPAKINPKKVVDPAEAGRLKAAERHAPKDLDNNKGAE